MLFMIAPDAAVAAIVNTGSTMPGPHTIGIDLGGTYIKGGVLDASHTLTTRHQIPTEADGRFKHVVGRMAMLVEQLLEKSGLSASEVGGVGVGTPGPLSHTEGIVHGAPNLPGFENVPLRDEMNRLTGLPVTLDNDANAAAFGEFTAGAGRDVHSMVMMTLGTGIGGGIVLEGKLWRGRYDNGGEIGHMIIVPGGRPCPCGQLGCFERYASAASVADRLTEAVQSGEDSSLTDKVRAGAPFDARHVIEAAENGDNLAARIWDETCYYLAVATVNLQHTLNPELIVLAGGLINAGDKLLDRILAHHKKLVWKLVYDAPRVAFATLGTDAGTIGAAALAATEAGG